MRNFSEDERNGGKRSKGKAIIGLLTVLIIVGGFMAATYHFNLFGGNGKKPDIGSDGSAATLDTASGGVTDPPGGLTRRDGVYTFLCFGVDKSGMHTDVIMVVLFDTNEGKINVLNIPRDSYSNANTRSSAYKHINLAYAYGGLDQLKYEIKNLIGYSVDRYVKIDMDGFVKVINYIGGVEFDVPQNMYYTDESQNLHINIKAGLQTLNGEQALKLCRYRSYPGADITRIEVRSDFLKAAAEQVLSSKFVSKAAELAGTMFDNVTTDMSLDDMVWFAKKAVTVKASDISFYTMPGGPANDSGMWIPYHDALLEMLNENFNPFTTPIPSINIVSRSENKGK